MCLNQRNDRLHQSGETDMNRLWFALLLCVMPAQAQNPAQKLVMLDGFHNNESKMPDHYQWDGIRPGGFSEFGKLLVGLGAQLKTVRERVTPAVLAGVQVFIDRKSTRLNSSHRCISY